MEKRLPDVYTFIEIRGVPFRIDVFFNPDAQEWRWEASSETGRRGRYADDIYGAVNPIFKRTRMLNMRPAVMRAVEEGLKKLAGSRKRWGLLAWNGIWEEQ